MKYKIIVSFCLLLLIAECTFSQTNSLALESNYLDTIKLELKKEWPNNRTINIVFHGHSVPAGFFNTPNVKSHDAYPHLVFHLLKEKYPYAVINIITTGIGGENSVQGAKRFDDEVLNHKPDVLFIDYVLNDRGLKLSEADSAWSEMIKKAQEQGIKVILLTATPDKRAEMFDENDPIVQHTSQVRKIAEKYQTGLADSFALFIEYLKNGGKLDDVMSWVNHPNKEGHIIVATEIMKWF